MSDDQQSEEMRPIPDGGLKDAMPSWLKRPPAWRSMPTAEERHERALPEPDTSEIDPKTLVDINDLPQWLQTIAARGEVPQPIPDQTVGHALEQVQAASARMREDALIDAPPATEDVPEAASDHDPVTHTALEQQEVGLLTDEPATSLPPAPGASRPPYLIWGLVACGAIITVVVVIILFFL